MKVIDHVGTAQTVTYLPPEVLELIIDHLRHRRRPIAAQKDLWACCLVAKEWYETTIKHLYDAPVLSPRNFTEFAITLSPRVASRVRRVGLEDFVQHLDMGSLAYESKKSTTARLISRTKNSLRTFVAPAVSFSTTSLAPLSRCSRLEYLDLSRDSYDFKLVQLMRSIKSIRNLTWLSLPKDCIAHYHDSVYKPLEQQGQEFWPIMLQSLQLNEHHFEPTAWQWKALLASLPPVLTNLSFRNCTSYDAFDHVAVADQIVPQVKTLVISVNRGDDTYYLNQLVKPFPNITKLTVPAITSWIFKNFIFMSTENSWSLTASNTNTATPPQQMEVLVLEQSPDFVSSTHITVESLRQFVTHCPKLVRIEVPEAYFNVEEDEDYQMDLLNESLTKRAEELTDSVKLSICPDQVGIYTTQSNPNLGVGLKRSFIYRAEG
ncbi:hypothetical protein H2198_008856 [Neophaeococcomyces mojaviensis]|uniref:Uncharacterized protein n=1 Tax=Neophaeococcomyces mojaviensis TaxID=3383035 RepID=A0ACC2ZW09_9EURO|nr:hypothetical protein H2198_008856 [Knufia sp. JES_112]